jgi:uncharacterized membrane protein (DUF485 family)
VSRVVFDWVAISADPSFRAMLRRRRRFVFGLLGIVLSYFMLLPVAAAYFPELMAIPVIGAVNVGMLLVLSQFVLAAAAAALYVRRAGRDFDPVNAQVVHEAFTRYRIR